MLVKRYKNLFAIMIILLIIRPAFAQGYFEINDQSRAIYKSITELRFDEAKKEIARAKNDEPLNLFVVHLENYIDFFTVFINENEEEFKRLEKNKDHRLKLLKSGDKNDPYYRLVRAEIHMQWAISRLKFEEYYSALLETRKAHKLLTENKRLFPEFIPTYKGLAMIHAVIGTIPASYRYLVELLTGLEGNINLSLREMDQLVTYSEASDFLFKHEAYVIYSITLLYLDNDPKKAWEIIKAAKLDSKNSPLAGFILANIARRAGKTSKAIEILSSIERSPDRFPFIHLDFMLGLNKLHRLDPDADIYLLRFVNNFEGKHYIKEAYLLLAWHSLLILDDKKKAKEYYKLCIKNGDLLMDEDKSAHKEAEQGIFPDPLLLKIRLLFDGGYYKRSLNLLESYKRELSKTKLLEYRYRSARNYQAMGNNKDALALYIEILSQEKDNSRYQYCNASLQAGIIEEKAGNIAEAEEYFSYCLRLHPEKYKNSLHQKAKAGMDRLKN